MSGSIRLVQEKHPEAVYIHCYAHKLNLVLCHTCKAVPEASELFETLESVYCYFSVSIVNHQKFYDVQMLLGLGTSELVQLSKTRWGCQVKSVKAMLYNLQAVLKCLEDSATSLAVGGLYSRVHLGRKGSTGHRRPAETWSVLPMSWPYGNWAKQQIFWCGSRTYERHSSLQPSVRWLPLWGFPTPQCDALQNVNEKRGDPGGRTVPYHTKERRCRVRHGQCLQASPRHVPQLEFSGPSSLDNTCQQLHLWAFIQRIAPSPHLAKENNGPGHVTSFGYDGSREGCPLWSCRVKVKS